MNTITSTTRAVASAATLVVVSVVIAAVVVLSGPDPIEGSAPYGGSSSPAVASIPAPAAAHKSPAPTPVRLAIPSIGVDTVVTRLGLNRDDTVQVPKNAARAGWFKHGPPPGQLGSSVILGHVDSKAGPAVFYRISSLRPGDRINVRLSDKTTARFKVTSVDTYANDDFPARQIYTGDPTAPSLNLVTCGGRYDRANGGYQSNVVVHAVHVRTT